MVDFQPQFTSKLGSGARLIRTMNWDGLWNRDWQFATRTKATEFSQIGGLEVQKRIGVAAPGWITSDDVRGMSVEHKIDLANQLGTDLWMCVPRFLDNTSLTALGNLVNSLLAAGKRWLAEVDNEAWNGAFPMNFWARWAGIAQGWDSPSWTLRTPSTGPTPPGRRHAQVRYDAGRLVLFGGEDGSGFRGDTWTWDEWAPVPWVDRSGGTQPSARARHAMSTWYPDTVNRGWGDGSGRIVLFGGIGAGGRVGDTWEWNSNTLTWTAKSPATSPSARSDARAVFDVKRGVVVLFGGDTAGGRVGDTWEWDGTNWTQRSPASAPAARSGHHMVYDEYRQLTVLWGGEDGSGKLGDTWEYDGTNWTQVANSGFTARSHGAAAFDGGIRMFGGLNAAGTRLDDTMQYRPGTGWVSITVPSTPPARAEAACCMDPHGTRIFVWGGATGAGNFQSDNYTLSGDYTEACAKGHARRHVEVMTVLEGVVPSNRLQRVLCWQAAGGTYHANIMLGHENCAAHTDLMGFAPYIGYDADGNQIDTSGTVDDIMTRVEADLPRALAKIDAYMTMLQSWPGIGPAFYEWGQHVVRQSPAHETNVFAAMDSARMEAVYTSFLAGARTRMGALAPMAHYSSIDGWGGSGQWGLFRTIAEDPLARARYRPIRAILQGT